MSDEIKSENNADITVKASVVPEAPQYAEQGISEVETIIGNKPVKATQASPQPIYFPRVDKIPPTPPPLYRESAARKRNRRRRGRKSGGEWAWVIIAITMIGVIIIIGLATMLVLRSSASNQEILPTASMNLSALPTAVNSRTENEIPIDGQPITLDDGSSIILRRWDGSSRLTVLVMGLDRRPSETSIAFRTDTMMLVSLDPQTNSLGILSVPRDLYVDVPGYSQLQRINTPMVLGEGREPGSGPTLAMQTVQLNFGISVHAYVVADFNAFIELVDSIGGIDVTNDYTINDQFYPDMNYGYDPFYLPAGTHHLNGYDALRFARTRHGDSDFERARRQQEVIYSVRDRILNFNMLPQLIFSAPGLLASWDDNVYTNLNLEQIIQLAWYLKDVPVENIQTGVIDYNYVSNYTTSQGASVLIPNRYRLSELLIQVFGENYAQ